MRKTLHEYVIDCYYNNKIENDGVSEQLLIDIIYFAKLTNRTPKLGDFIPCDEEGNVLDEPVDTIGGVEFYAKKYQAAKDRVIFKGDWECLGFHGDVAWIQLTDRSINIHLDYDRIEDLPREIEFKEGVI